MKAELRYGVCFGKGDGSDYFGWDVELTPEEEVAYKNAVENKIPLESVEELKDALDRAYAEIEEEEISNGIFYDVEFVQECQGEIEMDCEELNELVHNRDAHALEFFGLVDSTDEEISAWDAYDLEDVPMVKDFVVGFEPESPFLHGWDLNVEFVDPNEDNGWDDED